MPHETLHGTVSILVERPKVAVDVGKMGAINNEIPFIFRRLGVAQSAAAQI